MTDRPILFSGPMVRALLDGRKTQTRRLLKNIQWAKGANHDFTGWQAEQITVRQWAFKCTRLGALFKVPYAVGDRLWVRESWTTGKHLDDTKPSMINPGQSIGYLATEDGPWLGKLRPSIFMPRWASRITLTVTDVRVQRLQDIRESDAKAEGTTPRTDWTERNWEYYVFHTVAFIDLWDSLNAKRAPWDSNPWVVAYTFTVAKQNIDVALT